MSVVSTKYNIAVKYSVKISDDMNVLLAMLTIGSHIAVYIILNVG